MSTMTPMTPMTSWFFACFPLVSKWYQLDLHPIDQRSSRVQLEAWLTSLLQTVKIFLLNRITHKVWTLRGTFPRDLWNVFLIVIQCYPFATGYCSTLIYSTHYLLCSIMFNDFHQRHIEFWGLPSMLSTQFLEKDARSTREAYLQKHASGPNMA